MLSTSTLVASRIDVLLKGREFAHRTRSGLLDCFFELTLQLALQFLNFPALDNTLFLQQTLEYLHRVLVRPTLNFLACPVLRLIVYTVPLHPPTPALDE